MRPHIMIVDDTADQLQLMRTVFRMVNPSLKIVTAASGEEALNLLRAPGVELPMVILLDIRMPGKNGQEVLAELKADHALRRIPVCAFSNGDVFQDIYDCYEHGAAFYFRKPAGLDELKEFSESFGKLWFKYASHC